MTRISGLIFDKDGTLFDFSATWEVWAYGFLMRISEGDQSRAAQLGRAVEFDLATRRFSPTSIVIAGTAGEVAETLKPFFPDMTMAGLLEKINLEAALAPQQEAVPLMPLLQELRSRGLALGVATNDAEAPARKHLAEAGVTQMFDFIAGYDSGHGGKPAPGQLLAFAQQSGLAPAEIAMIGDSTHDLQAGRAAGMTCIAVLTGPATHDALAPFADVVLPDIGHLPGWLDSQKG